MYVWTWREGHRMGGSAFFRFWWASHENWPTDQPIGLWVITSPPPPESQAYTLIIIIIIIIILRFCATVWLEQTSRIFPSSLWETSANQRYCSIFQSALGLNGPAPGVSRFCRRHHQNHGLKTERLHWENGSRAVHCVSDGWDISFYVSTVIVHLHVSYPHVVSNPLLRFWGSQVLGRQTKSPRSRYQAYII